MLPRILTESVSSTSSSTELVIGNIARRVLHIIREEVEADEDGQDEDLEVDQTQKESAPAMGGLSRAFRSDAMARASIQQ